MGQRPVALVSVTPCCDPRLPFDLGHSSPNRMQNSNKMRASPLGAGVDLAVCLSASVPVYGWG